jgi:hypothetical protein
VDYVDHQMSDRTEGSARLAPVLRDTLVAWLREHAQGGGG